MALEKAQLDALIASLAQETAESVEHSKISVRLDALRETARKYAGEDRVISSLEIAKRLKTLPPPPWIKSRITGLDSILTGFLPNQVITLAAPTKHGKTSFCVELTVRWPELAPLWLPLEESAEELIQKFLDRDQEPPLFFTPSVTSGDTLLWVEKKIVESIAKFGTKVVFLDHLHRVVSFKGERIDLRIGETMQGLKQIAKKWGVTIFVIVHLKKTFLESQPEIEDLRDSSFIAQESDTVLMLWRESWRDEGGEVQISERANLSVQANRRTGKTGNVKLIFKNGRYYEQEWKPRKKELLEAKEKTKKQWKDIDSW